MDLLILEKALMKNDRKLVSSLIVGNIFFYTNAYLYVYGILFK